MRTNDRPRGVDVADGLGKGVGEQTSSSVTNDDCGQLVPRCRTIKASEPTSDHRFLPGLWRAVSSKVSRRRQRPGTIAQGRLFLFCAGHIVMARARVTAGAPESAGARSWDSGLAPSSGRGLVPLRASGWAQLSASELAPPVTSTPKAVVF